MCYRGAIAAAGRYGVLIAAAFDLHRFDMLAAMHLPTHSDGDAEYASNLRLTKLLTADRPWPQGERRAWTYAHPPALDQVVASLFRQPGTGESIGSDSKDDAGQDRQADEATEAHGEHQSGDRTLPAD